MKQGFGLFGQGLNLKINLTSLTSKSFQKMLKTRALFPDCLFGSVSHLTQSDADLLFPQFL